MIYWFTGQPSHGKTVLAEMAKDHLIEKGMTLGKDLFRIDGDDMRELFANKDYSIKGRVENVGTAQRIAQACPSDPQPRGRATSAQCSQNRRPVWTSPDRPR